MHPTPKSDKYISGSVIVTLKDGTIEEQFDEFVNEIAGVEAVNFIFGGKIAVLSCEDGKEDEIIQAVGKSGHTAERELIAVAQV